MNKRLTALAALVAFLVNSILGPNLTWAQTALNLPQPGALVELTPAFMPVMMKGLKVHPENPLLFDFIMDTGHSGLKTDSPDFRKESNKLIKYFLASLTIKEEDLWVNLSPYEKDRMITEELGKTELGRDMLEQDYILKQLTASLIYPEKDLGKAFWDKVYAQAKEKFGTSDVPVDTFNKVWIVADKAKILERNNAAYVVGAHLKVMLESDYWAAEKSRDRGRTSDGSSDNRHPSSDDQGLAKEVVREVILPALETEVNSGANFAPLRQMFYSMVLASWYKLALKDAFLNQVYANKAKTGGVLVDDPQVKEEIYARYLEAYKKGVFNYIKEETDRASGETMPRKYFSGGLKIIPADPAQLIERATVLAPGDTIAKTGDLAMVTTNIARNPDAAMRVGAITKMLRWKRMTTLEQKLDFLGKRRPELGPRIRRFLYEYRRFQVERGDLQMPLDHLPWIVRHTLVTWYNLFREFKDDTLFADVHIFAAFQEYISWYHLRSGHLLAQAAKERGRSPKGLDLKRADPLYGITEHMARDAFIVETLINDIYGKTSSQVDLDAAMRVDAAMLSEKEMYTFQGLAETLEELVPKHDSQLGKQAVAEFIAQTRIRVRSAKPVEDISVILPDDPIIGAQGPVSLEDASSLVREQHSSLIALNFHDGSQPVYLLLRTADTIVRDDTISKVLASLDGQIGGQKNAEAMTRIGSLLISAGVPIQGVLASTTPEKVLPHAPVVCSLGPISYDVARGLVSSGQARNWGLITASGAHVNVLVFNRNFRSVDAAMGISFYVLDGRLINTQKAETVWGILRSTPGPQLLSLLNAVNQGTVPPTLLAQRLNLFHGGQVDGDIAAVIRGSIELVRKEGYSAGQVRETRDKAVTYDQLYQAAFKGQGISSAEGEIVPPHEVQRVMGEAFGLEMASAVAGQTDTAYDAAMKDGWLTQDPAWKRATTLETKLHVLQERRRGYHSVIDAFLKANAEFEIIKGKRLQKDEIVKYAKELIGGLHLIALIARDNTLFRYPTLSAAFDGYVAWFGQVKEALGDPADHDSEASMVEGHIRQIKAARGDRAMTTRESLPEELAFAEYELKRYKKLTDEARNKVDNVFIEKNFAGYNRSVAIGSNGFADVFYISDVLSNSYLLALYRLEHSGVNFQNKVATHKVAMELLPRAIELMKLGMDFRVISERNAAGTHFQLLPGERLSVENPLYSAESLLILAANGEKEAQIEYLNTEIPDVVWDIQPAVERIKQIIREGRRKYWESKGRALLVASLMDPISHTPDERVDAILKVFPLPEELLQKQSEQPEKQQRTWKEILFGKSKNMQLTLKTEYAVRKVGETFVNGDSILSEAVLRRTLADDLKPLLPFLDSIRQGKQLMYAYQAPERVDFEFSGDWMSNSIFRGWNTRGAEVIAFDAAMTAVEQEVRNVIDFQEARKQGESNKRYFARVKIAGQDRKIDLQIPPGMDLGSAVKQVTFAFDLNRTILPGGTKERIASLPAETLEQLVRACRIMKDHPDIKIRFLFLTGSSYKRYMESRFAPQMKDWDWDRLNRENGYDVKRSLQEEFSRTGKVFDTTRAVPFVKESIEMRMAKPIMEALKKEGLEDQARNIEFKTVSGSEGARYSETEKDFVYYRDNNKNLTITEQLEMAKALSISYLERLQVKSGNSYAEIIGKIEKATSFLGPEGVQDLFHNAMGEVDARFWPWDAETAIIYHHNWWPVDGQEVARAAFERVKKTGVLRPNLAFYARGGGSFTKITMFSNDELMQELTSDQEYIISGGDTLNDEHVLAPRNDRTLPIYFGKRADTQQSVQIIAALDGEGRDDIQHNGPPIIMKNVLDVVERAANNQGGDTWGDVKFLNGQYSPNTVLSALSSGPTIDEAMSVKEVLQNKTVLMVDDDRMFRMLVKDDLIKEFGMRVLEASNSKEALDILGREKVDVVLSDYDMPPGMTGVQLAKNIPADLAGLPFVILTGHDFSIIKQAGWSGPLLRRRASSNEIAETLAKELHKETVDEAMNPGGIELNAKNLDMDVSKDGRGVEMKLAPGSADELLRGDFTGVVPVIIRITPIESLLPVLGIADEAPAGVLATS